MSGSPTEAADIIDREILLTRAMARRPILARAFVVSILVCTAALAAAGQAIRARPGLDEFTWRHALRFGEKVNTLVLDGQLWRLASSVWLHADPVHLMINAWAIWLLGPLAERLYGPRRWVAIVGIGGLAGAACSVGLTAAPSVGASGAGFALVGALAVFAVRWRDHLPRRFARVLGVQVALYACAGVVLALTSDAIDHAAHLGGFVAGAGVAAAMGAPSVDRRSVERSLTARVVAVVVAGAMLAGVASMAREAVRCGGSVDAYNGCYGPADAPPSLESGEAMD